MKITVKEKEAVTKDFPKLMKLKDNELIVLFTSCQRGTVIYDAEIYTLGYYHTDWATHCFEDFDGEITLSNN